MDTLKKTVLRLKKFFYGDVKHWHKFNYIVIGLLLGLIVGFFSFHEQSDLDRRVREIAEVSYPNDKEKQNAAVREFRASIDELYEFSQGGGVDRAQKAALDQEARTDINEVHSRLEAFYADNGYYPTNLSQSILNGITYDSLIDREGRFVAIDVSLSDVEPTDYFTLSAPDNRYRYAPYGCEIDSGQPQDFCRSYVLFAWLESGSTYVKKSLN